MLVYAYSRRRAAIAGVVAPTQRVPATPLAPVFAAVVEVTNLPGTALTVSNTGPGLPAAQVRALFEPFRRLTADRTGHGGGVGPGLSIVRSITVAHRGTVPGPPRPGAA